MPDSKPDAGDDGAPFDTIPSPADASLGSDETQDETNLEQRVVLRLNAEHFAALERIAASEGMSKNNALKRLIRLADQLISGEKSPFRSLDLKILRKVG